MPTGIVLDIARAALTTAFMLAAPLLLVAMAVGLLVSIIQAVTSIQEQTLSFVPKLIAVGIVFLFLLSWMLQVLMTFTLDLFRSLPALAG
jgi:flagellar biosynthesis protein FliQ